MCRTMTQLKEISEQIYKLEQERSNKKKELDTLEKQIKELKNETSSYMKKRQKNELAVGGFIILWTAYTRPNFDKDAFITNEENGEELYKRYLKDVPMERVTVKVAK